MFAVLDEDWRGVSLLLYSVRNLQDDLSQLLSFCVTLKDGLGTNAMLCFKLGRKKVAYTINKSNQGYFDCKKGESNFTYLLLWYLVIQFL